MITGGSLGGGASVVEQEVAGELEMRQRGRGGTLKYAVYEPPAPQIRDARAASTSNTL
jgi:hypothetical protein